jgi:hypothetical protein
MIIEWTCSIVLSHVSVSDVEEQAFTYTLMHLFTCLLVQSTY